MERYKYCLVYLVNKNYRAIQSVRDSCGGEVSAMVLLLTMTDEVTCTIAFQEMIDFATGRDVTTTETATQTGGAVSGTAVASSISATVEKPAATTSGVVGKDDE